MPHRSIAFTHAAFLVFSAALAFLVMRGLDENSIVGQSAVLWVRDSDGSANSSQVVNTVESFGRDHRITVGRKVADLRDPGGRRHLYLTTAAADSAAASWPAEGYPAFGRAVDTEVHPFTELDQRDPRGFYYIFGPRHYVYDLADELSALGLRGEVQPAITLHDWLGVFGDGPLPAAFNVAILCGIVAVGSGVLLNAKAYGVLRLQGRSFSRILLGDLGRLGRFWLAALTATAAATVGVLGFYNGLAQFGMFVRVALFFLAIFTLVGLATHVAALTLLHGTDVLGALKGKVPARLATAGAYAARIPAMLLVSGILGATLVSLGEMREYQDSRAAYEEAGDATQIFITGSVSDQERMDTVIGSWLRRAGAAGQTVLVGQERPEQFVPQGSPPPAFEVLVVNDTYLEQQPVLSPSGERYGASRGGQNRVRVLVPETLHRRSADIMAGVTGWVDFQTRDNRDLQVDIERLPTEAGQSMFTYGSELPGATAADFVDDPVIVAVPNGSDVLHDMSYFDYATQEAIVFDDPRDVSAAISEPPLSTYVNGMQPVAQQAAEEYRDLVGDFRLEVFNLAAGVLVVFITGISVCIIHTRKNAQGIFARHISGWTFAATHRRLLTVEALLAFAFVGWATWDTVSRLNQPATLSGRQPGPPVTGAEPFLAPGLAAVSLALMVAVLVVFHRRIIREGAAEA
ncbi:bacteriocin-associated integral membrane family protein [Salinactinospora qingdaonensis]|uniref:Bacteriocin-associated integral membrane family protein n=1 Tax=Salinactinospora qingdaonensis TaxID=702744 RepID=A0ABP7FV44_9ACTN